MPESHGILEIGTNEPYFLVKESTLAPITPVLEYSIRFGINYSSRM